MKPYRGAEGVDVSSDFWSVLAEVARGRTFAKALRIACLRRWGIKLQGLVLDLGCGPQPDYRQALGLEDSPRVRLVGVDHEPGFRPTVVADLTGPLPFQDAVADAVICQGFLLFHPEPLALLCEIRRLLKHGGTLVLDAPHVRHFRAEPTDFYRFSEDALRRLLGQAGFSIADLAPLGDRWMAAANILRPFIRPRRLTGVLVVGLCLLLDQATQRFLRRIPRCPIDYLVRAFAA